VLRKTCIGPILKALFSRTEFKCVREGYGKKIQIKFMEEQMHYNVVLYLTVLLLGRIIYRNE
jgi:hypothetical protein